MATQHYKFSSLIVIFILLIFFILPLSGCKSNTSPIVEPPPIFSIPLDQLYVDWNTAFKEFDEKTIRESDNADTWNEDLFRLVESYSLKRDGNTLSLTVKLPTWSNTSHALQTTAYLLRSFNDVVRKQDDRIPENDENTYGGLYDVANVYVKAFNEKETLIDDNLPAGEHRKRGLQLFGNQPSVDFDRCIQQMRTLYPFQDDTRNYNLQFYYLTKNKNRKNDSICFILNTSFAKKNIDVKLKEVCPSIIEMMNLFNLFCQRQDPRISNFSSSTYGGIFDSCHFELWILAGDSNKNLEYYRMTLPPETYKAISNFSEFQSASLEEYMSFLIGVSLSELESITPESS